MNNVPKEVRKAIVDALNGVIKYNGIDVPIYTIVPEKTRYPYIEIADIAIENDSSQMQEEATCDVVLEIVSGWASDDGGFHVCDAIEEDVTDAISDLDDQTQNELTGAIFVRSNYLKDYDGARVIIRRRVTYQVITQQV